MGNVKKICLSCRYYRLSDIMSGVCRVDKKKKDAYPVKLNEDVCPLWSDCGQQYFIRRGWIKGRKRLQEEKLDI